MMIDASYIVRTDDNRALDIGRLRFSAEAREWQFFPIGGYYAYSAEALSDIARQMTDFQVHGVTDAVNAEKESER